MDERLSGRLDILRKQSRELLSQVNANSKKIKHEIRKLYSSNLRSKENSTNYESQSRIKSSFKGSQAKSWKLRNDSSGVGGALRSDCFCSPIKRNQPASMPNPSMIKRVLISSKKRAETQPCSEICRRPVKECYCNFETKKVQLRSARTIQHKQYSPCKRCKSHATFPARVIEDNNVENSALSSPISCETLRRVQKIDYTPRSQFLRNVRSRVSLLQTAMGKGDCPDTCSRSQCYHEFMARKHLQNSDSELSRDKQNLEEVDKTSKGIQVSLKKHSSKTKLVTRRTLSSSKTSVPELTKPKSKVAPKGKRIVPSKDCQCCDRNKSEHSKTDLEREKLHDVDDEEYQETVCVNRPEKLSGRGEEDLSDGEVRELRKFREQNYFDTHGSKHTLVSTKSSGSLEQYLLNDRLFPEPTRRIHKKDLVVTMPPCATLQRKRIHYFPRYIVRQEKSSSNANCKKKRCQTCPLTGHAIDLGITKVRPPLNSLALKYQKRLP